MNYNEEETRLCNELRNRVSDLKIADSFSTMDCNLIRFLRARNMDLDKAENMYRKYIQWRTETCIDSALTWDIAPDLRNSVVYKITGQHLKGGIVLCAGVGPTPPRAVVGRYDEIMKTCYHELEILTQFMKALFFQSNRLEKLVAIINLEGLTFAHVTTFDCVQALITLMKTYEACFPETLEAAFFVNVPWVFSIAWSIVKPFISTTTRGRLRVVSGSDKGKWKEEIVQFVAEDQFPAIYGGKLPDDFQLVLENGRILPKRDCANMNPENDKPCNRISTNIEELD